MMRKLGYGPDNRLAVKLSTRNVPGYRDAAVLVSHGDETALLPPELNAIVARR